MKTKSDHILLYLSADFSKLMMIHPVKYLSPYEWNNLTTDLSRGFRIILQFIFNIISAGFAVIKQPTKIPVLYYDLNKKGKEIPLIEKENLNIPYGYKFYLRLSFSILFPIVTAFISFSKFPNSILGTVLT